MQAVISPGFNLLDIDPATVLDELADAVVLQNGNILLVSEPFGSNGDVQMRIFTAAGVPVSGVMTVNTTTFDLQNDAKVTQLANGTVVVTWTDASETAPDFFGETVRMQMFTQDGVKIGGEITVPTVTAGDQSIETVVALNDGRFAVFWDDSSTIVTKFRIYNADGTPAGGEQLVNGLFAERDEGFVASHGNGGMIVSGIISAGGNRVMVQRYNADGTANGAAIEVSGPVNNLSDTSIARLANGNYVVSWTDGSLTPPYNKGPVVYAQVIDAAGNKIGGTFPVSDDIFSEHDRSEVTALDSG